MKHEFFQKIKERFPKVKRRFEDVLDLFLFYQLFLFLLIPNHLMAILLFILALLWFVKDYKTP